MNQPPTASSQPVTTVTAASVVPAQPLSAASEDDDRQRVLDDDRGSGQPQYLRQYQRRSDVNGDVFYVSGRANTAPCTTTNNELADQTLTTFKYLTYDRDYFRERQKSSTLQDRNLRHSMD